MKNSIISLCIVALLLGLAAAAPAKGRKGIQTATTAGGVVSPPVMPTTNFPVAGPETGTTTNTATTTNSSDQFFLARSEQEALLEISLAQIAVTNSQNSNVVLFAQSLVTNHTAQVALLQNVANTVGITLPQTHSLLNQIIIAGVSTLNQTNFDCVWTTLMVESHIKDLRLHEYAAQSSPDPTVRAYARSLLVPLATHLETALTLSEQLRTNSVAAAASAP